MNIAAEMLGAAARIVTANSTEKVIDTLVGFLHKLCWQVFDYLGDDELISSCNDEYHMADTNYILTDGAVHMRAMRTSINTFAIRGASYVIICNPFDNGKMRVSLHLDRSKLIKNFSKIMDALSSIPGLHADMVYYMSQTAGITLPQAPSNLKKDDA